MLRYPQMLERALSARGHLVCLLHPPAVFGRLPWLRGTLAKWIRYIDKFLIAPPWLRWKVRSADIVHICDQSNSMYLWCAGNKPHVITCHDLIAVMDARGHNPYVHTGMTGRLLQRWIATGLAHASWVICVSNKTEADLRALLPRARAKIRVIPHTLNRDYKPAERGEVEQEIAKLGLASDTRYLLHVGGNQWYKNRPGAMRIFAELRKSPTFHGFKLVMAGKPWTQEMRDFAGNAHLDGCSVEVVTVTDEALRALYSGAAALLFPSFDEGFGWPILEAQACGCPVITVGRPPMTEVAGDAAILIDPTDAKKAADMILRRWTELPNLREAGFRNLERFTEEKMATAYCNVYEELWPARCLE